MKWGKTGILLLLVLCISGAYAMTLGVQNLPKSCTYGTTQCAVTSDITSGVCRTIKYSTAAGPIQVQVCDKGSTYELYKQAAPSGALKACVGGGCVDQYGGFASFTSTSLPAGQTAITGSVVGGTTNTTIAPNTCTDSDGGINPNVAGTTTTLTGGDIVTGLSDYCTGNTLTEFYCSGTSRYSVTVQCTYGCSNGACLPAPAITPVNTTNTTITPTIVPNTTTSTSSLLSPSSTMSGMTRDAYFETMVDSWFKSANVIQKIQTSQGTSLWVPWMNSATASAVSNLQSGGNCNIGTVDLNNNCMVTDEFSQVGMVLSMSTRHQADFDAWVNTVRQIQSGTYGTLPVWKESRTANGISTAITGNHDSASDADARIIIALYTAANNNAFSASQQSSYRQLADTMAADFIKYDFMHVSKPGLNGVIINNFPASGGAVGTGAGMTWGSADYAGYAGDRAIALLAAYKSTGNSVYLSYAKDDVNAYLLAPNFDGTHLSVAPKSYSWDVSGTTPKSVCSSACGGTWDDSDAVRAVSLAKAQYDASLMGVDLGLKPYLQAWMNSGGVKSNAYSIQYTFAGAPYSPTVGGMYENGLGATLNFVLNQQDLATKLDEVATHYNLASGTFDYTSSDGVYRSTFFKVNLGSAIGRDARVFSNGAVVQPAPVINTTNTTITPTPTPSPSVTGVAALSVVSTAGTATSDTNDGSCRTLQYGNGEKVMICDKVTAYEMYDQIHVGSTNTCVGSACVGPLSGYARWAK